MPKRSRKAMSWPATVAPELLTDLLRNDLGFNGVILTDASIMVGLTSALPRERQMVKAITAGCDMILFSDDPNGDLMRLVKAVADGRLSQERVDEAVTRILALKAALGLHKDRPEPSIETARQVVASDESRITATGVTARVPTLVKDVKNLLPLSPARHKRVLAFSGGVILPRSVDWREATKNLQKAFMEHTSEEVYAPAVS